MGSERPSVNITPAERIARFVLGPIAVVAAVTLFQDANSVASVILKVLLGVAGLDLVVNGATGSRPMYKIPDHVPASRKGLRSSTPEGGRHRGPWRHGTPAVKLSSDYLTDESSGQPKGEPHDHGEDHAQMLLACSTLMLFIVFALVGTGVWGWNSIVYGLLSVAMMAAMMLPMPRHPD